MPRRPLKIGLSSRLYHPPAGAEGLQSKTLQYLEQSVAHWIMSREVMVLMIPAVTGDGLIHRSAIRLADYARYLDALVLQGGADVSPATYGEEPMRPEWSGDRVRDAYEMELFHEFVEAGKPVLGICRGAQLINVALGGTLYQDIPTQVEGAIDHLHPSYDRHSHPVRFEADSLLARLYPGAVVYPVISIHHQAIRTLARGLRVEAYAAGDEIIEAIRGDDENFVIGLQWHPEFHAPGASHLLDCTPILDAFLAAARSRGG